MGYEAVGEIRRIEKETGAPPTPVLALTAHAFADMKVKGNAAGFTELLTKPIRRVTLLEALATCGGFRGPKRGAPRRAGAGGTACRAFFDAGSRRRRHGRHRSRLP